MVECLLQGKYAEAQPLFERALAIEEAALGVDHTRTITSRAWMADLYQEQGFFDKSSLLMEEVVRAREHVLGCDHPEVAIALHNRAGLLKTQVRAVRIFHEYCVIMKVARHHHRMGGVVAGAGR